MTAVKPFDLSNSPLEGTNLIEASAGTGKTYTITGLFLRLVLEKNLSVKEILVVTFTEAATEELRDRIRRKLREATEAFSRGRSEDAFLEDLVEKHGDSTHASRCLREALRGFDEAAIFTIHGFCWKMLHENAFESHSLFDTELVADQEDLKSEIVDDFWRKHLYGASPLFINYAINNRFTPASLLSLLGNRVARPYLKIIPQVEIPDSSHQEKEFRDYFDRVCLAWESAKPEVEKILTTHEGLNRNTYRKTNIPVWIRSMDDYVAAGTDNPALFQGFEKFTASELKGAVKKNHVPPTHPFFDLCEKVQEKQKELEDVFEQRLLWLKRSSFHYVKDELSRRKQGKNVQSFDDLLVKLHQALEEKGGETLAGAIRMKFRAALIDEFQDTDPIQYAIFKRVFGTEKSILFLIGDPKQAIYGFRGADIFAYMEAARHVKSRYTLRKNWRSEPDLIASINALFANAGRPFVYDEIPFQPATPAKREDPGFLRIDGKSEPPLQLWFLDASRLAGPGKAISKTQARELIREAVVDEISRLLHLGRNNRALLRKRPLREGDIAVLVRRNAEARQMQEALSALNIPSVLYSTANLFDSLEALEMERVLGSIAEPKNERLLKAALATDMMGVDGEGLVSLMEDETGWEEWLVKFKRYHDLWSKHGFIRMFRCLMSEESVLPRLMSLPDGERRNTNLLHLSEVLHQTSIERKLGMVGLLKWLSEQRDPGTLRLEEHQLRLETDENAIKLVTIHKSKGLEYPVVFCPFTWDGSRIKNARSPFTFHNGDDNMRVTLDLGSEEMDENRVSAEKELLAENLRLLYVALTRARSLCYLVWGRFNEAETSAPAYLFHQPRSGEGEDVVNATGERFKGLSDEDMVTEIKNILDKADGTIRLAEFRRSGGRGFSPLPKKGVELTCREFTGNIDRQWHISSFSSMVSGLPLRAELADRDGIVLPDRYDQKGFEGSIVEEEGSGIFSFPRGTKAGILFHDIFEHLDFAQGNTSPTRKLVANKLNQYGFELTWQETVCSMIQRVLSAPLSPDRKDFTLSLIKNKDRLNELEFYFHLRSMSPNKLKGLFAKYAGPELPPEFPELIGRLDFSLVRGFMKGFIDMVFQFQGRFYLVDWKSNFLGSKVEDYDQEALAATMEEELYILQYHIYTIALDQYLHLRLDGYSYARHFGGIYYIFLRGVDPDKGPDFGIYRDRPSGELIDALCANLIDRPEVGKS